MWGVGYQLEIQSPFQRSRSPTRRMVWLLERSVVIALIGCGIDSSKAVKGMNPDIDIDIDVDIRTLKMGLDVAV